MPRTRPARTVHPAGPNHQVISVTTPRTDTPPAFQSAPCQECPWRRENTGTFPAEAFRISAGTCHDASTSTFACHVAGERGNRTCAGFLLSDSAVHNLNVRMRLITQQYHPSQVSSAGADLYRTYREMAEANGVDPEDPALTNCR